MSYAAISKKALLDWRGVTKEGKDLINKWATPPTSLDMLRSLDDFVYNKTGDRDAIEYLQGQYDLQLVSENTTHEAVAKRATWRKT